MKTLSVTEYAAIAEKRRKKIEDDATNDESQHDEPAQIGLTRQAVLWQIKNDKLPPGVTAKKVGTTYVIFMDETVMP